MQWLIPVFIVYAVSAYALLYVTSNGMRRFTKRIINIIIH